MFINITEMKYIICCTSENTMNLNVNKIFLMIQLTADNCNELDSFAAKSKLCLLDVSGSWDMWYLCFNLRVCLRSRTKKKKNQPAYVFYVAAVPSPASHSTALLRVLLLLRNKHVQRKDCVRGIALNIIFIMQKKLKKNIYFFSFSFLDVKSSEILNLSKVFLLNNMRHFF